MRELTYYVAVTLDGYIAGPGGEYDAFLTEGDHMAAINDRFADTIPTDVADALGIPQHRSEFDTVLMGWNTYAVGLPHTTSPYRHLRQFVFSRSHTAEELPGEPVGLTLTDEDPVAVVRALKQEQGGGIWLCGGGALASSLAAEVDRLVLKRQPLRFGDGIALFAPTRYAPQRFDEISSTAYRSGVVVSEYVRRRAEPPASVMA